MDWTRIGEFGLDVLREIGNIGAGHAATALSALLLCEVQTKVPNAALMPFDQVATVVGGPETVIVAIFLRVSGELSGNMFYVMTLESASEVLRILGTPAKDADRADVLFSEMEVSALQEVGNILVGSYLSALADLTKLRLAPSVPALAVDMAGALLSVGFVESMASASLALVIDTSFVPETTQIDGHFLLFPDPGSVQTLFKSLGVEQES